MQLNLDPTLKGTTTSNFDSIIITSLQEKSINTHRMKLQKMFIKTCKEHLLVSHAESKIMEQISSYKAIRKAGEIGSHTLI